MSQNVNTWGNINVNVRLGTKTETRRMEEKNICYLFSLFSWENIPSMAGLWDLKCICN